MSWHQATVKLKARKAGCHLITDDITSAVPEIKDFSVGIAHIFLQHTSAALTLNENCDPDVRQDLHDALERLAPRDGTAGVKYIHDAEGPDDMPGHVKSSLLGASLSVPISRGRLALGTWQGVYLVEARDAAGSRRVVVTLQGQRKAAKGASAAAAASGAHA